MPRHRRLAPLLLAVLLAIAAAAGATTQVDPEDRCSTESTEPGVACVDPTDDPDAAEHIVWVMATGNGASIYLTEAGIAMGRSCDGAAEIVALASDRYARIPAGERSRDDLLWADPALTREVFAHAWATSMGSDRGNPVDVVFDDYTGDPASFQSRVYRGPALAALCPGE